MAYADENYDKSEELYDTIAQVFENYKYGLSGVGHTWNTPANEIRGITMRLFGENKLMLTYHRYEVGTQYDMERLRIVDPGEKYLGETLTILKKEFKESTGKVLGLKEEKKLDVNFEKTSRLTSDRTGLFSSMSRQQQDRYLVRTSCVYEFNSSL